MSRPFGHKCPDNKHCKSCSMQKWRAKNAEHHKTYQQKYDSLYRSKPENSDKSKKRSKIWQVNNPERVRKNHLWIKYKLTVEDYQKLLCDQSYVCALCHKPWSSKKNFDVDHCHKTGKVRGLLCQKCNKGLGHFYDDPELLLMAIDYLSKFAAVKCD